MKTVKYVYPRLVAIKTTPFIRIAGSGLANSLFVFARAITLAEKYRLEIINPTWLNFDPGQWRRWSKDKRTYYGLFKDVGASWFTKLRILIFGKKIKEEDFINGNVSGDYVEVYFMKTFDEIIDNGRLVKEYLINSVNPKLLKSVNNYNFNKTISVHVRLGDYAPEFRQPISWYKTLIMQIKEVKPDYRFLIFSDGTDEELMELTELPSTERVFFGSSIADIFAISETNAIIASHSTFSDWGGYLGQLPALLPKQPHYGSFLKDKSKEFIITKEKPIIPKEFFIKI